MSIDNEINEKNTSLELDDFFHYTGLAEQVERITLGPLQYFEDNILENLKNYNYTDEQIEEIRSFFPCISPFTYVNSVLSCYSLIRVKKEEIKKTDIVINKVNKFWVIDEKKTIHLIDLEINSMSPYDDDIQNFCDDLSYREYLIAFRNFLSYKVHLGLI